MGYTPHYYTRKKVTGWEDSSQITLSTQLILEAATELGVAWKVFPGTKIFELSYEGEKKYFRYQISTETTDIGFYACEDKSVTNNLLAAAGINVANGYNILTEDPPEYWEAVFQALSKPLVVKPTHGNQGDAISLGITTLEQFQEAVKKAFALTNQKDAGVLVEETCKGQEYRILLTREKVLGIAYRRPANVVGDGSSTIQQLIDVKNQDPRRDPNSTISPFKKIKVDEDMTANLREQGLTAESVPAANQRIFLRKVSNISKGGQSIDFTDQAHPSVKEIALKAVQAIPGLDFAGLDFMTPDITKDQAETGYTIIEVNSSPGFCIQELPDEGEPRNAQYEFVKLAFPSLRK
ncbi:hypothetical protein H3C66_04655 [Patescibacteria group bacterium]|nr:hypothetical protein [Patescibacteria group bacterium]